MQSIGLAYALLGKYEEAIQAYLPPLRAKRKILPKDHYDILILLQNIGSLYASAHKVFLLSFQAHRVAPRSSTVPNGGLGASQSKKWPQESRDPPCAKQRGIQPQTHWPAR